MKFFYKLFLGMVLILTVALAAVEYFTVAYSLECAFQRELNSELTQHQLVKYSIQSSVLTAVGQNTLTEEELTAIGEEAAGLLSDSGTLTLYSSEGTILYSNVPDGERVGFLELEVENNVTYQALEQGDGSVSLVVESPFTQSGEELVLETHRNITNIFQEAEQLRTKCVQVYWVVLGIGGGLTLLLSWLLTRPLGTLQRASRAFAAGDYQVRAKLQSRDEMGELADSFNQMADTLQEKIYALEDAARRQEDFTANFAHELKTPMTSIIGYADTLYQKTLSPEQVHQAAGYIMNEGMRLEALSFKLLELLTLDRDTFTLEETQLEEMFVDLRDAITPAAEKRGVTLSCRWEKGWVRLEYDLFKTLMLNLLDNALKSGGTKVYLEGEIVGEKYQLSVTDNGRGIPADELTRITEAFYMIDKSRSRQEHGAGLGLALAEKIARLHGSSLHYESELYEGTRVTLRLALEGSTDET